MSVPAASFERKGAARGRELAASMDFVRGRFEAVFAPRKFERLDKRVDTFLVRLNGMRFRHSVDGREVQTGGSTPGYLDTRIRRLFSSYGDHRPSLSLFRRPKGSVVELYGFLRVAREDDPLTVVPAGEFLEEHGFFARIRGGHHFPRLYPRPPRMRVRAGLLPFLLQTQLAGWLLLAAGLALAGASRRRCAGFVLAFLLVVLYAAAIDGALVRRHRERLDDAASTPFERAHAASGLARSFFFAPE